MLKKLIILILLILPLTNYVYAQTKSQNDGSITGRILDSTTKEPVELSDVVLFNQSDSTQVTGTTTNKEGRFVLSHLKTGKYYLVFQFISYVKKIKHDITISSSNADLNLGDIYLKPTVLTGQNVVVEGRRSAISYQMDKKVIDVNQMQTATSGSAVDVLENIPSINVDINGNVSLRGSTNFKVLINGQPSVLSAQDALQQIPASSIKSIQIITNPSAKYDASGTAGIINIVLKKNTNLGSSGIVNLMGGMDNKYGGNVIYQYNTHTINYNIGVDFNRRDYPGSNTQNQQYIIGGNTSFLDTNGNTTWGRTIYGVRGGLNFNMNDKNNLSVDGRYGYRTFLHKANMNYVQWSESDPQKFSYIDKTNHNHSGSFYDLTSNYDHKFNDRGHELTGEVFYRHNNSNENTNSIGMQEKNQINGTKTTELGPESEIRAKLDYTLPINKKEMFSAGSEYFTRLRKDINKLFVYDSTNNVYQFQPNFSHTNDFNRTRFAAYSMFSDHWDSLGIQIGFRTEYTYQLVKMVENKKQFSLSRWDYFPSLYASYNFGGGTQIMAGYSRRIRRPDGGDLEPFYSWYDANNVHIGNPSLKPEFIDSYEVGFQTFIGKISLSDDFYYRFTHNKMERINSVFEKNVTLETIDNVGTDYSLGSEIMVMVNPFKFWDLNLMGDVYDYKIRGSFNNNSFARHSFNWSVKNNNVFHLTPNADIQINTRYYSPSVSAQGKWGGFFTTDVAARQNFMDKKYSITLQMDDIFGTAGRKFSSQGADFYNYSRFTRAAPVVMLNLKYNFNGYKKTNQSNEHHKDE